MADPRSGHFGGLYVLLTSAKNCNGAAIVEMAMAEGGRGLVP
jgi:hypothetical protein